MFAFVTRRTYRKREQCLINKLGAAAAIFSFYTAAEGHQDNYFIQQAHHK
jgi:hypothetical protein